MPRTARRARKVEEAQMSIISPNSVDPAKIDQQWELLKLEANEVASVFQALVRKMQSAVDGGDTAAAGWLNDLKVLAAQVRKEQDETQSLVQLLHDFAAQSLHELAGHQAAAQAQSAPPSGGADPYAVVPDVPHAAAPAPAADPYAVVPDVPHAAPAPAFDPYAVVPDVPYVHPAKPAVDPYAVVMDHPNRDAPIPPWYTEAPAASAVPTTQPVAAAAPAPAAPAPAFDPYAVVPDVPYVHPAKPAVDPYAVVMDKPNRDSPIPPWYTEAPAASGVPSTQPVAAPAPAPAASVGAEPMAAQSLPVSGAGPTYYAPAPGAQPGYAQPGQAPGPGGPQGGYAPGPGGAYDPNYAAGGAYGGGQGNTQAGSTLHRFMHGSLGRTVAMEGGGFAMNEVWSKMGI
jgi:hypothetical protein